MVTAASLSTTSPNENAFYCNKFCTAISTKEFPWSPKDKDSVIKNY
jgi:hypothetical protein